MVFRKFALNIALKTEPIAKKISMVLFVIVLLRAILAEKDNIVSYFADAGLITLVLNVMIMIAAFYIAQLFGTGNSQKMYCYRMWFAKWYLSDICWDSFIWGGIYVVPAATYSLIMFVDLFFVFLVKKI